MSRTTIWNVYRTKATFHSELHNSWHSAPPIWDYLCEMYLDGRKWLHHDDNGEMWDLWKNKEIPDFLRCSFLLTFDWSIAKVDDLPQVAEYCRLTHQFLSTINDYGSHWESIADAFIDIWFRHDYRLIGVALGCTSVSDPWWNYNGETQFFAVMDGVKEISCV